jgi:hypothetical protein
MYSRQFLGVLKSLDEQRFNKQKRPKRSPAKVKRIMEVVMICDEILDERDGVTYDEEDPGHNMAADVCRGELCMAGI